MTPNQKPDGISNNINPKPTKPTPNAPEHRGGSPASPTDAPASTLARRVKTEAIGAAEDLKGAATGIAGEASQAAQKKLQSTKEQAADGLGSVAAALRSTSQNLKESDQGSFVNGYVDSVAAKVEGAADYLHRNGLGQMVHDLEGFARRKPALFMGGALFVGLLGGRFFKSSRRAAQAGPNPSKLNGTSRTR